MSISDLLVKHSTNFHWSHRLNSLASARIRGFSEKKRLNAVCSTDPVKESKNAASLVCTRKKNFCLGGAGCLWVTSKRRTFRPPWPTLPGPGGQPLGGTISLKLLLETKLQSKSFHTLDDLLGFRVQKLWCKLVKIFD